MSLGFQLLSNFSWQDVQQKFIAAIAGLPFVARLLMYREPDAATKPKIQNPDILLKFAQRIDEHGIWRVYTGTVMDAHQEGVWVRGRSHADKIYLIATGECLGDYIEPVRTPDGNLLEQAFVRNVGKRN